MWFAVLWLAACAEAPTHLEPAQPRAPEALGLDFPRPSGEALRAAAIRAYQTDPGPAYDLVADDRGWTATNAPQAFTMRVDDQGLGLNGDGWYLDLHTTESRPVVDGNLVSWGSSEWMLHGPLGVEHGFTLASGGDEVRLSVPIDTDLHAEPDRAGVRFVDDRGTPRAWYTGLYALDAAGRFLPASMHWAGDAVDIVVDTAGAAWPVEVDPIVASMNLLDTLFAEPEEDGEFGLALDLDGDTLVVGARRTDDRGSTDSGAVYVFVETSGRFLLEQKIVPTAAEASGWFGGAVAIDGDTLVIGASERNGAGTDRGQAWVYDRTGTTWSLTTELVSPSIDNDDRFGFSVAIDGTVIAVGAPDADLVTEKEGAVAIFELVTGTWTHRSTVAKADLDVGAQFGFSVAVSGNLIAGGAPYYTDNKTDQGRSLVYELSGGTATQKGSRKGSETKGRFGFSVDITATHLLVGAPGKLLGTQITGYVRALSGNAADGWTIDSTFSASDGSTGDYFGWDVQLTSFGAVVGAPGAQQVYGINATWGQDEIITDPDVVVGDWFGRRVAWDGNLLAVGSPYDADHTVDDAGSVVLFDYVPTGVESVREEVYAVGPDLDAGAEFGTSVAIDGDLAVVGACGANAAVVYEDLTAGWTPIKVLVPSDYATGM
ncbi:MAG: hypothetical protein JRJ84_23735, partial [Deltaproteobacteria bacterium]|nr:hypothetical protein [Deltaproteobacteria bacterium]